MTLSADELEILDYLKSWKGSYVTMVEICRCAGGRRKYRESPNWARALMSRLVDGKVIEVNERGHYRVPLDQENVPEPEPESTDAKPAPKTAMIVGDNYFPAASSDDDDAQRWISPQIAEILKNSGKKFEE
jgi:hypothetical protein